MPSCRRGHRRPRARWTSACRRPESALGRRRTESPEQSAGLRFKAVHPAVARADKGPPFPDRRRHANGAAGVGLPSEIPVAASRARTIPSAPPTKHQSAGGHGRGHARQARGGGRCRDRNARATAVCSATPAGWRRCRHCPPGRSASHRLHRADRPVRIPGVARLPAARLRDSRREIEIARRAQAGDPVQRQVAVAHRRPPVQQAVGDVTPSWQTGRIGEIHCGRVEATSSRTEPSSARKKIASAEPVGRVQARRGLAIFRQHLAGQRSRTSCSGACRSGR